MNQQAPRPFKVLGVQQIAIGALSKDRLTKLWIDLLGLERRDVCANAVILRERRLDCATERANLIEQGTTDICRDIDGGLAADIDTGRSRAEATLTDGRAAELFARMVRTLGGPADLMDRPVQHLTAAKVVKACPALRDGHVTAMNARDVGLVVVELGGGRRRADDKLDHSVGLTQCVGLGRKLKAGEPLAIFHAATAAAADAAIARLQQVIQLGDAKPVTHQIIAARVDASQVQARQ